MRTDKHREWNTLENRLENQNHAGEDKLMRRNGVIFSVCLFLFCLFCMFLSLFLLLKLEFFFMKSNETEKTTVPRNRKLVFVPDRSFAHANFD